MLSHHSRFRFRPVISLLLILAICFGAIAQVRRRIQVSRSINPSPVAGTYFRGTFRFGGGVVPRGTAQFLSPDNKGLNPSQLELVILDNAKLANDRTDLDAIGLKWQGQVYKLAMPDDFVYPLAKFVQRESEIAYTIPVVLFDEEYLKTRRLKDFRRVLLNYKYFMGYAAEEFESFSHKEFLEKLDLSRDVGEMTDADKRLIMEDIKKEVRGSNVIQDRLGGSYVNADFHVIYHFYLTSTNGKNVVDSDGVPFRYYFRVASDNTAIIRHIQVFAFPEDARDPKFQDQAILFFQTTAILRQLYKDNRPAFNRFLAQVAAARRN